MQVHYEPLSNTEKYFIVILLITYAVLLLSALLMTGSDYIPCKLDIDKNCDTTQYFLRLLPFYAITFSLNIGIVLSAYYLNKLAKKSIYFFRTLTIPPFIFLIYYSSQHGNELLRAFSM
jgi:hypothetical protein